MNFVNAAMTALGIAVAVLFVALQVAGSTSLKDSGQKRVRVAVACSLGAAGWLAIWYFAGNSGAFSDFDARPPRLMLVFIATLSMGVLLGFSKLADRLNALPIGLLLLVQGFRVPL